MCSGDNPNASGNSTAWAWRNCRAVFACATTFGWQGCSRLGPGVVLRAYRLDGVYTRLIVSHCGEANCIKAAVTLYVSSLDLFTSLLHLLGFTNNNQ